MLRGDAPHEAVVQPSLAESFFPVVHLLRLCGGHCGLHAHQKGSAVAVAGVEQWSVFLQVCHAVAAAVRLRHRRGHRQGHEHQEDEEDGEYDQNSIRASFQNVQNTTKLFIFR